MLDKQEYILKLINQNQLRVNCTTVEAYKQLIAKVREMGLIGHTFTRKEERCYRVVIKNLHHSTPHEAIIEAIEKTGNTVCGEIINARVGPEKRPTSTFFVNIDRNHNNKAVKSIRHIYNMAVTIEDPRKRNAIVQCTKCQQYGHSKNNCMSPDRCIKCAGQHKTSDCEKKDRNTPAKCALCLGEHPANYKGCKVYQEILNRKKNNRHTYKIVRRPNAGPEIVEDHCRQTEFLSHNQTNFPQLEETLGRQNREQSNDTPKKSQNIALRKGLTQSIQKYFEQKKQKPKTDNRSNTQQTYSQAASSHRPDEIRTKPQNTVKKKQLKDNDKTTQDFLQRQPTTQKNSLPFSTQEDHLTSTQVIQDLLIKQLDKMDKLFDQMSMLIGLVVSLVDKMSQ